MKDKNSLLITLILVVVVGVAAFWGGMQYQKSQRGQFGQFARMGQGGPGGANRQFIRNGGQNGQAVIGEILSKDDKSVTVKLPDGSSKIVILSGSTSINKQASGSASDLKTGERVAVFGTSNSDGSVTAQNIQLNPTNGGPMMFRASFTPTPTK